MAIRITEQSMTSDVTPHIAWERDNGGWAVTWLPQATLTRNQAVTAMTIAETVVTHADEITDNQSRWWRHIDGWAAELHISGPKAVAESGLSREEHGTAFEWPPVADEA